MKIKYNFDLTDYNSYKIEARCRRALFPETERDVINIFEEVQNFTLLGGGNNVIFSKKVYDSDFVIFNGNFNDISLDGSNKTLICESGASMLDISMFAYNNKLTGLEMFYDIPSSLGGAVVMNAGANGEEIKDMILRVRYLDLVDMKIYEKPQEELYFSYRNSFFQENPNKIVLKVWLKLKLDSSETIWNKMTEIKSRRVAKQPKEYPSAGSVFKRPEGKFVGPMIENLGLKGYCVGGAKVSEKHAGFIINYNNASGEDILNLIEDIKEKVAHAYGVVLEIEQRII